MFPDGEWHGSRWWLRLCLVGVVSTGVGMPVTAQIGGGALAGNIVDAGGAAFGTSTSAGDPRVVQLAVKFSFLTPLGQAAASAL